MTARAGLPSGHRRPAGDRGPRGGRLPRLPGAVPGGFVGVDVFFVISGFLITSIVAGALERGDFSLRGFYARRVRRILRALAVLFSFWATPTLPDREATLRALDATVSRALGLNPIAAQLDDRYAAAFRDRDRVRYFSAHDALCDTQGCLTRGARIRTTW